MSEAGPRERRSVSTPHLRGGGSRLSAVIEAHLAEGYELRPEGEGGIAVCRVGATTPELVFKAIGPDRATEEGRELVRRGARRIVGFDLARAKALEWSEDLDAFETLSARSVIEDLVFATGAPVRSLVGAAKADQRLGALGPQNE